MSERKILVPEGMMSAGMTSGAGCGDYSCNLILAAALRWLSENPIAPTEQMLGELITEFPPSGFCKTWGLSQVCTSFQSIAFLATEPEVPEEIKDLLKEIDDLPILLESRCKEIAAECFRRGQKAGKP